MMDHQTILSTGFLLLCGAVFVHSLKSANAFPQGPNINMGSNPIEHHYATCGGTTFFTNTTSYDFIITDIMAYTNGGYILELRINAQTVAKLFDNQYMTASLYSGIRVSSGDSVDCTGQNGRSLTISGYYTHP